MRRIALPLLLLLVCSTGISAQQNPADALASKEDVQKYLDVMHSREMLDKTLDQMLKVQRQMIHEQYLKDKNKLPADFEERMNSFLEETLKSFPWQQVLDSMVPVYQKHFSKGDLQALSDFYSSPVGQEVIRELPAISAEAMQEMMPLMQKQMAEMTGRLQKQIAQMTKEAGAKISPKS